MRLLIKGGTVVTASESFIADVAVSDGTIVGIGENMDYPDAQIVDATGKLVLPGTGQNTVFCLRISGIHHCWTACGVDLPENLPFPDGETPRCLEMESPVCSDHPRDSAGSADHQFYFFPADAENAAGFSL